MNHLRKLALLSSLALSFSLTLQADGTLPLPIDQSKEKLPMELEADTSDLTLRIDNMQNVPTAQPLSPTRIQPCARTDQFYSARGTVTRSGNSLNVVGICKPTADDSTRTVVAIDATTVTKASQFVLLQGTLDVEEIMNPATGEFVSSTKSLSGVLNLKPFSGSAPVFGPEASTQFTLYRIR
jgi:hypothetical protein